MRTYHPALKQQQQGAALMISMVLIFLLSIIGVSSMRGASVENQLATNTMWKDMTFQAAESATDRMFSENNALENQICQPDLTTNLPELETTEIQDTEAVISYGGQAIVPGHSLGGPISARRFVVTGRSELVDANTETEISQGIVLVGASDTSGSC